MVRAPLEAADFLSVSLETALRLQGRGSDVALQDHPIAAPGRQLVGIPRQGTWQRGRQGRLKGKVIHRPPTRRVAKQLSDCGSALSRRTSRNVSTKNLLLLTDSGCVSF